MGSINATTEFTPEKYPPFPADVPTAPIAEISLRKLLEKDASESERVFDACKTYGFFYLNLRDHEQGAQLEAGSKEMARVAEETFKLSLEQKNEYHISKSGKLFGYKQAGGSVGDKKSGALDTAEFYNIAKDSIVNNAAWPNPPTVDASRDQISPFMKTAHSTGLSILKLLGNHMGISEKDMENAHRITESSGDQVRFTRSPPLAKQAQLDSQVATPAHTDFGSITLLFNWLGGLQIFQPENPDGNKFWSKSRFEDKGTWNYVKPMPGYAICNLGDAMTRFTNGVMNSGQHRVLPAPGPQGEFVRYSIVYFVRPEDEVPLQVWKASGIPAANEEEETILKAGQHIMNRAKGLGVKTNQD